MKNDKKNTPELGLWRSAKSCGMIMGAAVFAAFTSAPSQANTGQSNAAFEEAHSLRSLDIMLMVTSLRCRSGPDDFQSEYHRFAAAHLPRLTAAGRTIRRTFAASYGERNPARALDRMGVRIANTYGDGHPWLSCAELKQAAQDLVMDTDTASLARSARYLLSATRPDTSPPVEGQPVTLAQNEATPAETNESVQITYNMTAEWEQRP